MQKYAKHDVTGSNSCVGKIMAVKVPKNTKILIIYIAHYMAKNSLNRFRDRLIL